MTVTVTQLASKANITSDSLTVGAGSERVKLSTKIGELAGGSTGQITQSILTEKYHDFGR